MSEAEIVQIIPAVEGVEAVFKNEEGLEEAFPVICWALTRRCNAHGSWTVVTGMISGIDHEYLTDVNQIKRPGTTFQEYRGLYWGGRF